MGSSSLPWLAFAEDDMAKALCGVLSSLKFCPRRFVQCVVFLLMLLIWAASVQAQKAIFSYAQRAVATGLSAPHGLAVDSSGNVYIADTDHHRVLKETLQPDVSYAESVVVNTGLSAPQGVGVDNSGNVYIADTGNNQVLKETVSGTTYAESLVTNTGLHAPQGVAVDSSGSVYIADTGNNRVLKV
jgi:DNA-binding beta-propeller fold protein YncE